MAVALLGRWLGRPACASMRVLEPQVASSAAAKTATHRRLMRPCWRARCSAIGSLSAARRSRWRVSQRPCCFASATAPRAPRTRAAGCTAEWRTWQARRSPAESHPGWPKAVDIGDFGQAVERRRSLSSASDLQGFSSWAQRVALSTPVCFCSGGWPHGLLRARAL